MATIKIFLGRGSKVEVPVRFRLSDGRSVQLSYTSDIIVDRNNFDEKKGCIKARCLMKPKDKHTINKRIEKVKNDIEDAYQQMIDDRVPKTSEVLISYMGGKKDEEPKQRQDDMDLFDKYIRERLDEGKNVRTYEGLRSRVCQYIETGHDFSFLTADSNDIYELIEWFKHPDGKADNSRLRGLTRNSLASILSCLKTFLKWMQKKNYISEIPWDDISSPKPIYGTPIFITVEERDKIAATPMPNEDLEQVRDTFVIHCFLGCRFSDLCELTKDNIINGAVEYIPIKTSHNTHNVVRVPISDKIMPVLERYKDIRELVPVIRNNKTYNDKIREVFTIAGVTRMVTKYDSAKGKDVQVPINTIASSHMARRTFIGNLYKKVQDPNLIASLSGHAEGSRAFARYRTIDEDMKKNLIDLL